MPENKLQVDREIRLGPRILHAGWVCKMQEDGLWKVHFWADYVNEDSFFTCTSAELFPKIQELHDRWLYQMGRQFEDVLIRQ